MDRFPRSLIVVAVTMALAAPAALAAQAIPRPTTSGSTGSTTSTGSSSGGGSESRVQPPSGSRTPSSSSSRSGSASSRGGSSASGRSTSGSESNTNTSPASSRTSRVSSSSSNASGSSAARDYYGSRPRGSQPQTGIAKERPADYYGAGNVGFYYPGNPFSPWGRWYPWYNAGFGYGYVSYDPWRYGSSRYSLWRYGSWYNPYDPFCYSAGYWMCDAYGGGWSGGGSGGIEEDESEVTGSVRLRVSPAHAKVFVDGTLVGVVDDFDGLTGRLKLTLGTHLVEIKADGYETFVPEIAIVEGKTTTVRGSLKKVVK